MRNSEKYDYLKAAGRGALLSFLLLIFYLRAHSQSYAGVEIGATQSFISVEEKVKDFLIPHRFIELGVKYQKTINHHFDFSFEMDYTSRGAHVKGEIYEEDPSGYDPDIYNYERERFDEKVSLVYLNAPVMLSYALIKNPKIKISGGIYGSYLVRGDGSNNYLYESGSSLNSSPDYSRTIKRPYINLEDQYSKLDIGTVYGFGYETIIRNQNMFFVNFSFQHGLRHLSPELTGRKMRAYILNLGILFNLEKDEKDHI
jgi:hypothetical protein